jgi:hypothetical protein
VGGFERGWDSSNVTLAVAEQRTGTNLPISALTTHGPQVLHAISCPRACGRLPAARIVLTGPPQPRAARPPQSHSRSRQCASATRGTDAQMTLSRAAATRRRALRDMRCAARRCTGGRMGLDDVTWCGIQPPSSPSAVIEWQRNGPAGTPNYITDKRASAAPHVDPETLCASSSAG